MGTQPTMTRRQAVSAGLSAAGSFVLADAIGAGTVLEGYKATIDGALGTTSEVMTAESTDDEPLYSTFTPPEEFLNDDGTGNAHALIQHAIDLNRKQAAEGAVLLKNENAALPLAEGDAVTMLGIRSAINMLGSSFGLKLYGPCITLEQALSQNKTDFANTIVTMENQSRTTGEITVGATMDGWSGDEFDFDGAGLTVNPTMISIYEQLNETYQHCNCEMTKEVYDPGEPSVSELESANSDFKSSFAEYGDAAIVYFSRPTAESIDYIKGGVAEGLGCDEPLQLTQNEKDLISMAKESFDKVIVILNTANAVEIKDLADDPDIDAILWIGFPGAYGMLGVADLLVGKASPSGGLTDTYASSCLSAPAMQNMGDYTYDNAAILTRAASMFGDVASKYVIEAEGIYVGYKYYETRYADSVLGQGNATGSAGATQGSSWNYADEVVYPFGYGLSYTTFSQEVVSGPEFDVSENKNGATEAYATFQVKVTNTGSAAGKSIVELYGQAPYTQGGLEKSAIQLLNYEKTSELEPGASETVEVKCDLQFIASYDESLKNSDGTEGGYVIEPGTYWFAVGNGCHEALNNILAAQGIDAARLSGDADASKAVSADIDESVVSKTALAKAKTGAQVSNHIEYADWNHFQPGEVTYLSRSDWQGTWPQEYSSMTLSSDELINNLNGNYYELQTDDDTSEIVWGDDSSSVMFWDLAGKDFDDPLYDEALNKMTLEEALYLVTFGGPSIPGVDSLGTVEHYLTENAGNGIVIALNATKDPEAPWAIGASDANGAWNPTVFANAPVTAASFDKELVYEMGQFMGVESLFTGIAMLWGPGLNIHRHQYNGRNGEYYSEDAILCGNTAMEYAIGALEYGLIASPKHFAFNDQETNRAGIAPYMTEQQARENELRGWQIAFEATKYDTDEKDAGMRGLMTSFSKIGSVECTCSKGLMTNILKEEWGFHGYAVTDIYDDTDLWTCVLVSGVTCFDTRGISGFYGSTTLESCSTFQGQNNGITIGVDAVSGDATVQAAVKESAHNMLYAMANSNLVNRYNSTSHMEQQFTWWRGAYGGLIAAGGALAVAGLALSARDGSKKEEN